MSDRIKDLLLQNIEKAHKGRELWLRLVQDYNLAENDYVVLMPSLNREYNYYSLLYLEQFLVQEKANKVIILTYDENVINCSNIFSEKIDRVVNFSRENAELLMKFYCLYKFTDKLIIASLEEPEGRSGRTLIGKKGLTLEEIISIGVYGLKKFEKLEPPEYTGNDENIIEFMKAGKGGNICGM